MPLADVLGGVTRTVLGSLLSGTSIPANALLSAGGDPILTASGEFLVIGD